MENMTNEIVENVTENTEIVEKTSNAIAKASTGKGAAIATGIGLAALTVAAVEGGRWLWRKLRDKREKKKASEPIQVEGTVTDPVDTDVLKTDDMKIDD